MHSESINEAINIRRIGNIEIERTFIKDYYARFVVVVTGSKKVEAESWRLYSTNEAKVKLYEKSASPGSGDVYVYYPYEIASRLIQQITDETDSAKLLHSDILGRTDSQFQTYASDGIASLIAMTNGYKLRGYDRTINFDLKNFFKCLDQISQLGLWYDSVNDRFVIESITNLS